MTGGEGLAKAEDGIQEPHGMRTSKMNIPKNIVEPVPEIQGKAKSVKKANPSENNK